MRWTGGEAAPHLPLSSATTRQGHPQPRPGQGRNRDEPAPGMSRASLSWKLGQEGGRRRFQKTGCSPAVAPLPPPVHPSSTAGALLPPSRPAGPTASQRPLEQGSWPSHLASQPRYSLFSKCKVWSKITNCTRVLRTNGIMPIRVRSELSKELLYIMHKL